MCCRMKISHPRLWKRSASQNQSRPGRKPPSTASRKELANLQLPKSLPRVAMADTPNSVQRTWAMNLTGANSFPTICSSFFPRHQALSRASLMESLYGQRGNSTTSATFSLLRAIMQTHRLLLAPIRQSLIWTDCSSNLAQIGSLQKTLIASWMVGAVVL